MTKFKQNKKLKFGITVLLIYRAISLMNHFRFVRTYRKYARVKIGFERKGDWALKLDFSCQMTTT